MKAYSLLKLLNAYSENKDFIHAYLKKQPIEGYKDDTDTGTGSEDEGCVESLKTIKL